MHKLKTLFISILLVTTTFSFTGCEGGEADYSFEDVLSAFNKNLITGSIAFDIPNYYVVEENTTDVTVIQTEQSSDKFSIAGGENGNLFTIDPSTGKLTFIAPSVSSNYEVVVGVTREAKLSTFTLTVEVVDDIKTVKPIIDYVVKTLDVVISRETLTQIKARPADVNSNLTFSLDNNKGLFQIDAQGKLTLIDGGLDYSSLSETSFDLYVTITDSYNNNITVGPIALTLVENADLIRPIIETSAIPVIENSLGTTEIKIKYSGTGVIQTSILAGSDKNYFTLTLINQSVFLAFKEANDYETLPSSFDITVQVGDDNGNLSDVQNIVVTVSDLDETFVFQGDSNYTPMEGTKIVGTVTATPKLEALALPPQYSLAEGSTVLEIDSNGNIQFIGTAQKDQSVTVQVRVKSELNGSETLSKVFVVNVQADPTKIQPTVSYSSTSSISQADALNEVIVTTVTATPEGSATSIQNYTIEGLDKDIFDIDGLGNITFLNADARQDTNNDNLYEIYVVGIDNYGNSNQTGTIKITLVVDETINFTTVPNINVDERNTVTVQLNAISLQGYDVVYSVTNNSSTRDVGISFNQITGEMFVEGIDRNFIGTNTHSITVKVNDVYGNWAEQSFKVTVK